MIRRGGFKPHIFISAIACTIGASEHAFIDADDIRREKVESGDGAIYLAGGYWRAMPVWDDDGDGDTLVGVRLVNPDRTAEECRAVERGIAILRHLDYDGA